MEVLLKTALEEKICMMAYEQKNAVLRYILGGVSCLPGVAQLPASLRFDGCMVIGLLDIKNGIDISVIYDKF